MRESAQNYNLNSLWGVGDCQGNTTSGRECIYCTYYMYYSVVLQEYYSSRYTIVTFEVYLIVEVDLIVRGYVLMPLY